MSKLTAYNFNWDRKKKLPIITVHGRFQPPLHANHWLYVSNGFEIAQKVKILITNPYGSEKRTVVAEHRSKAENNPFTYRQRVKIFKSFFKKQGIPKNRFTFESFDILSKIEWDKKLKKSIPNLVCTYGSPWSAEKFKNFTKAGLPTIRYNMVRPSMVSGTNIREILSKKIPKSLKKKLLIHAGYMPEAIHGLFAVIKK